ncbi:pentapeptide repeat-containing protein [Streptomyces sp. B21-102]|uniref:pentapeptide repeat-containing protein n=1 Tax=Streptomyces sp. B21-102 TaxID=3039416 RepID=UPI002FF25F8A
MTGKARWYHHGRASGGWHAPLMVRVWIVAPLAVLGAIAAGWLIYRLVVDRLVDDASDAIKTTLAILTLVGAVLAGVYAYRKQRIAESDAHRADVNQFADRYTTAAEQLGHDKAAVRLAGVYALARLADDWEEQRQVCIDVLCAYLRMPYQPEADAPRYREGEREVRRTIIRLIGNHLRLAAEHPHSWQRFDFDFTGVTFDAGDFHQAVFSGGSVAFAGAEFRDAEVSFREAVFSDGSVDFSDAVFSSGNVAFDKAKFSGAKVDFTLAKFCGARVNFNSAEFSSSPVAFNSAAFSGGILDFGSAEFSGSTVSFDHAKFSRPVNPTDAASSHGTVSFQGAAFSKGTVSFFNTRFSGAMVDLSAKFRKAPRSTSPTRSSPTARSNTQRPCSRPVQSASTRRSSRAARSTSPRLCSRAAQSASTRQRSPAARSSSARCSAAPRSTSAKRYSPTAASTSTARPSSAALWTFAMSPHGQRLPASTTRW